MDELEGIVLLRHFHMQSNPSHSVLSLTLTKSMCHLSYALFTKSGSRIDGFTTADLSKANIIQLQTIGLRQ